MRDLVVALSPELVQPGEHAFVERLEAPDATSINYSAVLTKEDCRDIDACAYRDARAWYRTPDGDDQSLHDGVSLGRAFEYVATTELIRLYRAKRVLDLLHADGALRSIELRGVSHEWSFAAHALGLPVRSEHPLRHGPLPGSHAAAPMLYHRAAAGFLSRRGRPPRIGLIDARAWAVDYGTVLADHWPLEAIDPGPRFVLGMARSRRAMKSLWLSDEPRDSDPGRFESLTGLTPFLAATFRQYAPDMMAASSLGARRAANYRVAVACEDVLPPVRAFILGFRNSGGRVVTLEHGISGAFADQVHSVADVLGVWGEPHRRYHSSLAPEGVQVSVLGWPRLEGVRPREQPDMQWDAVFFAQPTQDLASRSWPEHTLRARAIVEAFAADNPSRKIAIKPHPSSEVYGWKPAKGVHAQVVGGNSLDVLQRTRVAIVELSTTGIEAMAMGVPVVQLGDTDLGGPDFIAESGAPRAWDATELAAAVEDLLTNVEARERSSARGRSYAEVFVDSLTVPGIAAHRLTDLVESLSATVPTGTHHDAASSS